MSKVLDAFLRYVKIDTQSCEDAAGCPSTLKQLDLARLLCEELKTLGAQDVLMDAHGYVTATIPSDAGKQGPVIGLIAHMDTSDAVSGANVRPVITKQYGGGDIDMGNGYVLSPKQYPELENYLGQDIVCSDGSTLLGADDKAGVAEIMTLAAKLLSADAPKHETVRIAFTPDEEIGRGVDLFDVEAFGADYAYTVDGGALGEINVECFNAAGATVTIHGVSAHTGAAKGCMINAIHLAMELQSMLPQWETPACTEAYEGFYHIDRLQANVDTAVCHYLLRDHDYAILEQRKRILTEACAFLNKKYGDGTVELDMKDTYYNMKEKLPQFVVDRAVQAMRAAGVTPFFAPSAAARTARGFRLWACRAPTCPRAGTTSMAVTSLSACSPWKR